MRLLRGLGGMLLWLVACLLGLVAVLLCATVLLLPVGIPALRLSRRLFQESVKLMLPRAVSHPGQEARKSARKVRGKAVTSARRTGRTLRQGAPVRPSATMAGRAKRRMRRQARRARKRMPG